MTVLSNFSSRRSNGFNENTCLFCVIFGYLTLQFVYDEYHYMVPLIPVISKNFLLLVLFFFFNLFYTARQKEKSMAFLYIFGNFCIQIFIKAKNFAFYCICSMYVSYLLALPPKPTWVFSSCHFLGLRLWLFWTSIKMLVSCS